MLFHSYTFVFIFVPASQSMCFCFHFPSCACPISHCIIWFPICFACLVCAPVSRSPTSLCVCVYIPVTVLCLLQVCPSSCIPCVHYKPFYACLSCFDFLWFLVTDSDSVCLLCLFGFDFCLFLTLPIGLCFVPLPCLPGFDPCLYLTMILCPVATVWLLKNLFISSMSEPESLYCPATRYKHGGIPALYGTISNTSHKNGKNEWESTFTKTPTVRCSD